MAGRSPSMRRTASPRRASRSRPKPALDVLQHGGNAIDAAVTAAAVLVGRRADDDRHRRRHVRDHLGAKEKRLVALNASGRAGALMTREELLARGRTRIVGAGAESITVPGALAGWDALLKKYGTITLAQALQPAIRYADEGFPVTPVISATGRARNDVLERD